MSLIAVHHGVLIVVNTMENIKHRVFLAFVIICREDDVYRSVLFACGGIVCSLNYVSVCNSRFSGSVILGGEG